MTIAGPKSASVRILMGGILGPVEAWLLLRGMRTLALRFERASANALKIWRSTLSITRKSERVLYPGIARSPGPRHRPTANGQWLWRNVILAGQGRR